jgi:phosphopantetheinyl transferase
MKPIELPESWRARAALVKGEAAELVLDKRERDRLLSRAAAALLPEGQHVSFSHSEGYGAAAKGAMPVGIDVQVVREVSERTTHLFLTEEETEMMSRSTITNRLLHFWCAKEAEWKRHGGVTVTLKKTPVVLLEERGYGLLFDVVETIAIDDVIVALTRPTF